MRQTHPLPVHHSWPLYERERYFALGQVHGVDAIDPLPDLIDVVAKGPVRRRPRLGLWECNLADNRLSWSNEVYDIFGLPRGTAVTRDESVALYAEDSRAAMEKLRAYAIRHRRGFTLDVEIRPAQGERRWMRLIAAPVCDGDHIVKLHGLKFLAPSGG